MDTLELFMFRPVFGLEKMNTLEVFMHPPGIRPVKMNNSQISILSPSTGVVLKSSYTNIPINKQITEDTP